MLPGSVLTMQHLTKIEVNTNSKGLLDADDLKDEGIEVTTIPWIKDDA